MRVDDQTLLNSFQKNGAIPLKSLHLLDEFAEFVVVQFEEIAVVDVVAILEQGGREQDESDVEEVYFVMVAIVDANHAVFSDELDLFRGWLRHAVPT